MSRERTEAAEETVTETTEETVTETTEETVNHRETEERSLFGVQVFSVSLLLCVLPFPPFPPSPPLSSAYPKRFHRRLRAAALEPINPFADQIELERVPARRGRRRNVDGDVGARAR